MDMENMFNALKKQVRSAADSGSAKDEEYWSKFRFEKTRENIYKNPAVVELVQKCKTGDADAMLALSEFFRQRCSDPMLEVLNRYENDPSRVHEEEVYRALKEYWYEAGTAAAYMMWLYRAGVYGNQEASQRMERYRAYRAKMLIPERVFSGDLLKLTYSTELNRGGIMDIPAGIFDCGINYIAKTKRYHFWYVSDYIPADEAGFGREEDYASFYLDEFFNKIEG